METLARLVAPMMPHLAEEMHARLRAELRRNLVAELPWPEADPALLAAESVTIAVQVMGKLRGTIAVPPDAAADGVIAAAEAEPNVARALAGQARGQAHPRAEPHRQFRGGGMTRGLPRRRLLALGGAGLLAGCGFQPVYMPTATGKSGPAERNLARHSCQPDPRPPGPGASAGPAGSARQRFGHAGSL